MYRPKCRLVKWWYWIESSMNECHASSTAFDGPMRRSGFSPQVITKATA
ncbi:hypothetical protein HNQ79_002934 [Streptomyces candidus]|uniref:Uncharacterized protein n=1 Tax=Streptomyces candidus TaxID=67283 RepID=A0A7X0LPX8_9ACTN|nr:hypothetical protein [Streptomyces candidus]